MAHFTVNGSTKEGAITNVYILQSTQDKESFIKTLQYVENILHMPHWNVGGDFNMILMLEEKTGGTKWLEQDNGMFKTLIEQLNMVDMETLNGIFTWSNRRTGHQHVAHRLDHFLMVEALLKSDQEMEENIIPKTGSDHWPITFCLDPGITPRPKPFLFEKFWLTHPNFHQLAHTWWAQVEIDHGTHMYKFQQRLKNFKQHLKRWNKSTFGNIILRKKEIESELEEHQ